MPDRQTMPRRPTRFALERTAHMPVSSRTALISAALVLGFTFSVSAFAQSQQDTMSKDTMSKGTMSKDSMSKDSMSKESMSKDNMSKSSMSKETTSKDTMKKDESAK
jgi:pentapeptide MXKDX repeat protein